MHIPQIYSLQNNTDRLLDFSKNHFSFELFCESEINLALKIMAILPDFPGCLRITFPFLRDKPLSRIIALMETWI